MKKKYLLFIFLAWSASLCTMKIELAEIGSTKKNQPSKQEEEQAKLLGEKDPTAALYKAIRKNYPEIIAALISRGADYEHIGFRGTLLPNLGMSRLYEFLLNVEQKLILIMILVTPFLKQHSTTGQK